MFFSSMKGINRLISKGMSDIYLKVTIEKSWLSQNLNFVNLKNLSPGQFFGSSNSHRYWILKLLVATSKAEIWELCVGFLLFWFWKELCFKVKESMDFVEQKYRL